MTLRPTRRLLGVLVAAAVVYFFAVNSLLVWLYMVTAMLLALVPLGLAGPALSLRGLALDVTGVSSRGFDPPLREDRGRVFMQDELEVRLGGSLDTERCRVTHLRLRDGSTVPVRTAVAADGALLLRLDVATRGPLDVVAAEVRSSWPFGLVQGVAILPLRAGALACPRYFVVAPRLGAGGGIGGEDADHKGHGDDVVGLREYRPGDSRRDIHWMTTARAGRLMVVERAAPSLAALRIRLRLDPAATPEAVEMAVFVTASLAASCHAARRPFRLVMPDGPPEARRWDESIVRLARVRPMPEGVRGGAVNAAIRAEGDVVVVESEHGTRRLPPRAPEESVTAALLELL